MNRPTIRVERSGSLARVILDRPPLNVLTIAMMEELDRALQALGTDGSISAIVLTGAGKAYCAGLDVSDHMGERAEPMLQRFHGLVHRLIGLECPVVSAVNGAALGGGCELLMASDIVLAREGAKIGQPEIRLGVFPPVAVALLSRIVGRQRALDLILSGRVIEASDARSMGLVSQVFSADEFEQRVSSYLKDLCSLSRPVLRLTKRAVLGASEVRPGEAIDRAEQLYLGELMRLDDAHEGLLAFVEKRAPVWKEA